MTSFIDKEELKLVVVGDVGCGKTNFIKKILCYYPAFVETHRRTDDIYLSRKLEGRLTIPLSGLKIIYTCNSIRLHNVSDIKTLSDPQFYEEFDVIFYCYASDDSVSFQNLEKKWIPQMKSKAQYSFLVANLSTQQNSLVQKQQRTVSPEDAEELKKRFNLGSFVQHTNDYESLFKIFDSFISLEEDDKEEEDKDEEDLEEEDSEDSEEDFEDSEEEDLVEERRRRFVRGIRRFGRLHEEILEEEDLKNQKSFINFDFHVYGMLTKNLNIKDF